MTAVEHPVMDQPIHDNNSNKDAVRIITESREGYRVEGISAQPVKRIVGFDVSLRRVQSEQKLPSGNNESPTSVFEGITSSSSPSSQEDAVSHEHEALCGMRESTPLHVSPAKSHLAEALKRSHSMPFSNSNISDMDASTVDADVMTRRLPKLRIQHSRRAFS